MKSNSKSSERIVGVAATTHFSADDDVISYSRAEPLHSPRQFNIRFEFPTDATHSTQRLSWAIFVCFMTISFRSEFRANRISSKSSQILRGAFRRNVIKRLTGNIQRGFGAVRRFHILQSFTSFETLPRRPYLHRRYIWCRIDSRQINRNGKQHGKPAAKSILSIA